MRASEPAVRSLSSSLTFLSLSHSLCHPETFKQLDKKLNAPKRKLGDLKATFTGVGVCSAAEAHCLTLGFLDTSVQTGSHVGQRHRRTWAVSGEQLIPKPASQQAQQATPVRIPARDPLMAVSTCSVPEPPVQGACRGGVLQCLLLASWL